VKRLNAVDGIVLHCSDTEDGPRPNWEAIRRYHIEVNGWQDIGYHFVVERINGVVMVVQGRSPKFEGAHCAAQGRNRDTIGVCVVGDFDDNPPDEELYRKVVELLAFLCFTWHLPASSVRGHGELDPRKSCPGQQWDMDRTRAWLAETVQRTRPL